MHLIKLWKRENFRLFQENSSLMDEFIRLFNNNSIFKTITFSFKDQTLKQVQNKIEEVRFYHKIMENIETFDKITYVNLID